MPFRHVATSGQQQPMRYLSIHLCGLCNSHCVGTHIIDTPVCALIDAVTFNLPQDSVDKIEEAKRLLLQNVFHRKIRWQSN